MSAIKITAIYYSPKTIDCYTVLTDAVSEIEGYPMRDQFNYLACDDHGGTGFSQWGHFERSVHATLLKRKTQGYRAVTHLGKLVPFEQLTGEVQKHIAERILTDE